MSDEPDLRDILRDPLGPLNPGRILAIALARLIEAFECNPGRAQLVLQWEGLVGRHRRNSNRLSLEDEVSLDLSEEAALRSSAEGMLHRGHKMTLEFDRLLDEWYREHPTTLKHDDLELWLVQQSRMALDGFQRYATPREEVHLMNPWAGWTDELICALERGEEHPIQKARERLQNLYGDGCESGGGQCRIERELSDPTALAAEIRRTLRFCQIERNFQRWMAIEQFKASLEFRQSRGLWSFPSGCPEEFPEEISRDVSVVSSLVSGYKRTDVDMETAEQCLERIVAFREAFPASDRLLEHIELDRDMERKGLLQRQIGLPQFNVGSNWYRYLEAELEWKGARDHESEMETSEGAKHSIQWAKELLGMLPTVTKRSLELGKHPLSELPDEHVPESLRVLFEQAHLCHLFDLEIPCAMTCGSLIEEAIETRFPALRVSWERKQREEKKSVSWREKSAQVVGVHPRFREVAGIASDVVRDRNDAVHDPSKFLLKKRADQASLLRNTRKVLANLFDQA